MNYQFRSLQLSIVIHTLLFVLFINIGSIVPANKLMVIDFNLENSMGAVEEVKGQKPEIRSHRPEIIEQKQEIKNSEQNPVSPIIPDTHPTSISDAQAPVPLPKEQTLSTTKIEDDIYTSKVITGILQQGLNSPGENDRYLKVNFSYIRDMIQKKITYPGIARQMGWEGKVVVSFIVCADGYAKDIKIKEGSGIELLDKNAIETVKKASPFPKPPIEAQLLIPIKYSLN